MGGQRPRFLREIGFNGTTIVVSVARCTAACMGGMLDEK